MIPCHLAYLMISLQCLSPSLRTPPSSHARTQRAPQRPQQHPSLRRSPHLPLRIPHLLLLLHLLHHYLLPSWIFYLPWYSTLVVHLFFIHHPSSYHHHHHHYLLLSLPSTALVCTLTYYLLLHVTHARLQPTTPSPCVVLAVLPLLTLFFISPPALGASLASYTTCAALLASVPPTVLLPCESSLLHLHLYLATTLASAT